MTLMLESPAGAEGFPTDPLIVGRTDEIRLLHDAAVDARAGSGRALFIVGDAGIGKTAVLDAAQRSMPDGMQVVRIAGVGAEIDLPHAGLHHLLAPALEHEERLPVAQRSALATVTGLTEAQQVDRRLVGLAALALLSEAARGRPIAILIDDAHLLDLESLQAISFVARRIGTDPVLFVIAARLERRTASLLRELPTLKMSGLGRDQSAELLRRHLTRPIDPLVTAQIYAATGGNPQALVDFAGEAHERSLLGDHVPELAPTSQPLVSLDHLRAPARTWLLIAATEQAGSFSDIESAAARLGLPADASLELEESGLVHVDDRVTFANPLVRSAAYGSASRLRRREVHLALAAIAAEAGMRGRAAWHSAAAATGEDDDLAEELERAAESLTVEPLAVKGALLERAAALTSDAQKRADRFVRAADVAFRGGTPVRAGQLLSLADLRLAHDSTQRLARLLEGRLAAADGDRSAPYELPLLARHAADALRGVAPRRAVQAMLQSLELAAGMGEVAIGGPIEELAAHAATFIRSDSKELADEALAALAGLLLGGLRGGSLAARRLVDDLISPRASVLPALDYYLAGVACARALWDADALDVILRRASEAARRAGAQIALEQILWLQIDGETGDGNFDRAAQIRDEVRALRAEIGATPLPDSAYESDVQLAWEGRKQGRGYEPGYEGHQAVSSADRIMTAHAGTVIALAHGSYDEAWTCLQAEQPSLAAIGLAHTVLPDMVEAAARSGRAAEAATCVGLLRQAASAAGTRWAAGLLARSEALISTDPEPLFKQAIDHLAGVGKRLDLARAHLLFGEWLRREARKSDAGDQLAKARMIFESIGASAFVERSVVELQAAGHAVHHGPRAGQRLTPQEATVAGLAAEGATNEEIARRLFLSPSTVDYHLGKVYRKLNVHGRRALRTQTL